ncbi:unnamed protein product [Amoebophrya sp. A25]|nr:unnamed protein product [Amoebophrya sp. A25]|eukprot:GSA25T00005063001.1
MTSDDVPRGQSGRFADSSSLWLNLGPRQESELLPPGAEINATAHQNGNGISGAGPTVESPDASSSYERWRYSLLRWRLSRSYLGYNMALLAIVSLLLLWNLKRLATTGFLPRWRHHPWEEALEIVIALLLLAECGTTLFLLGFDRFRRSFWLKLDFFVVCVSWLSLVWAIWQLSSSKHKAGQEPTLVENFELPFLVLRFMVQPLRVVSQVTQLQRAQRSLDVDNVDFSRLEDLSGDSNGFGRPALSGT